MFLVRLLCSVLAALVAFFNVGSVPSFCARLPPPPPAYLLDSSAPSFSPPSGSSFLPPVRPLDASAPSFSPSPSCPLPPPSLWGHSCSVMESDSPWLVSATSTSLQMDLLDSTPTNSFVDWHENSDDSHEASIIAILVLIGVVIAIALQQCSGNGGSRAPAVQPSVLPPLVLPPPPPPYVPEPCAPSRLSLPSVPSLPSSSSSRRPSQPTPTPSPASPVMERLAARAAPARRVAGSRRKSRRGPPT